MNVTTATITGTEIVVAEDGKVVAREHRPVNLAKADNFLAYHSLGRTGGWDLDDQGHVSATVTTVDNRFNGVAAARLGRAVGTTHDDFELAAASSVGNGDLVTDAELSAFYVVAGSSTECGVTKLHMVADGKTWNDRYTSEFTGLVRVARKR
jgi:hypothetical protein